MIMSGTQSHGLRITARVHGKGRHLNQTKSPLGQLQWAHRQHRKGVLYENTNVCICDNGRCAYLHDQ